MPWSKAYSNWITWENKPSTASPIDEIALNKISNGLDVVDDRVISLESTKTDQADFLTVVQSIALNTTTGELIITAVNGTETRIDTLLEKIAVNFDFDDDPTSAHYQQLVIELDDGTYKYIDLSALITQYEFNDSDTIAFSVAQDGKISAVVKAGSINSTHFDPDYLAEIQSSVADAAASANDAADSADNAHNDALLAQSYAIGTNGEVREGDATDNSKYYKEQVEDMLDNCLKALGSTTFANLPTLANSSVGDMWKVTDGFTTTNDFAEGAGQAIPAGTYVYVLSVSGVKKWTVFSSSPPTTSAETCIMADGTTSVQSAISFLSEIILGVGAGIHNALYRGKNLGTSLTSAQSQTIQDGVFDDMFIGDYWLINGIHYRIAAFDYWYGCGGTKCTTHHVVIVPDEQLTTSYMNSTNVTTTAYYNSYMRQTTIPAVTATVSAAFGATHILTIRQYLAIAATNGYETARSWYDSKVDLMNEEMVYGGTIFANQVQGTNFAYYHTISKGQLPLFALRHDLIVRDYHWWLQAVASSTNFANVNSDGVASSHNASSVFGVRPAFALY